MHLDDINLDKNYSPSGAYGRSKLANILFTVELAKRLKGERISVNVHKLILYYINIHIVIICVLLTCAGTGVTVYAVNPGVVHTELSRYADQTIFQGASWLYKNLTRYVVKTPQQGAQTTLHCALDENCAQESGLYYR